MIVSQVTELCKRNCDKNSSKGITFGTKVSNMIRVTDKGNEWVDYFQNQFLK
jgi:hypothetical protein